ncbi:MAG TPA: choice-of-anchor J domain-containing protein, partial [Bacteroidota bacterium]
MYIRLLRTTLFIAGICLLAALDSNAQTQRSQRVSKANHDRAAGSGLSAGTIGSLAKVAAVTLPWFDDMENGAPGWTNTGFWHLPYRPQQISVLSPTINPDLVTLPDAGNLPAPFSGNYCWWYGENSTGTFIGNGFDPKQASKSGGTSDSSNSGNLITPPISLVGQTHAVLSFQTWWEIEGVNSDLFDIMSIEASSDAGVNWVPLGRGRLNPLNDPAGEHWKPYSSTGLGQKGSWTSQFFDLSFYAGKVIRIRFNFDTGDALYNGFRGWFIDDVSVTAGTLPAPLITIVTPPVVNPT